MDISPPWQYKGPHLNAALLSRCRVVVLEQLTPAHLTPLLSRALSDVERGLGSSEVEVPPEVLAALGQVADGDARAALNALELAVSSALAADGAGAGAAKQEHQGGDDGGGGSHLVGARVTVANRT